ncbi:uncharacterized protein C8R40DRAFT_1074193 [Lentinula edodes]|uniref:uncharacterized protein n=1 Tax=Lentinula edodes TaxID=5353 RepID=UPI001E8DD43B|nr:uncharacterized protein C8R40DRAFT_1074193 [Lentinula edodes]KAH7869237.1 hypothetical protein C8R40DRAFT_1074193 [Lentinula edodes]
MTDEYRYGKQGDRELLSGALFSLFFYCPPSQPSANQSFRTIPFISSKTRVICIGVTLANEGFQLRLRRWRESVLIKLDVTRPEMCLNLMKLVAVSLASLTLLALLTGYSGQMTFVHFVNLSFRRIMLVIIGIKRKRVHTCLTQSEKDEQTTQEDWIWAGTKMSVALLQPDRPTTSSRFKSPSFCPLGPTGSSSQLVQPVDHAQ